MSNRDKLYCFIGVVAVGILIVSCMLLSKSKDYVVNFNTNGGSQIENQIIKKGDYVIKPDDPIKEGYLFVQWDYLGKEYDFSNKVTSDMTLTAIWKASESSVKKYNVTFKLDNVEKKLELTSLTKADLQKLNFEEKSGYVIKWYLNDKEYDFTSSLNSDIVLIGKYEESLTFTIQFNSDGGSKVNEQIVTNGDKVKEPENVTKYGYILDGWYYNNKKYDFNNIVTTDMLLIAKWKDDSSVERYTVKFDSDGGNTIASQRVIKNEKVKRPSNPTKKGFAFEEWYLNDDKYDFNAKVTSNITLIAKWKELAKYIVSFDSNGGSSVPNQIIYEGNKAAAPTKPILDGKVFVEWQLDNNKYVFNTIVTKDITLKAVWRDKEQYTVIFQDGFGHQLSSQNVQEGEKVIRPSNPTIANYEFIEWQLDKKTFKFDTIITKSITLVASWKELPSQDKQNITKMLSNIEKANLVAETGNANLVSQITAVSGCNISISGFPTQIERDINNKTINVTVNVSCGSENSSKSKNVTISKSPYSYSKVMNSNMLNYDVTVNGGNWPSDGKLFLGTSGGFNVISRKAIVEISKIESNPTFKMRFNNDSSTIYIVPFK